MNFNQIDQYIKETFLGYPFIFTIGKWLLVGLFFITGIKGLLNPKPYVGMIEKAGLPAPYFLAITALLTKVIGSLFIVTDFHPYCGIALLITFLVIATVLYHPPNKKEELNNFLKNLSMIGGLTILAYTY